MKKITNILLSLIISVASLSVCYADWQTDLQTALNEGKTRLELHYQKIDNAGAKIIATALTAPNCKIAKLSLFSNNIDNEGAKIIIQAIATRGCKLNTLDLSNNNIDDAVAECIIEALTAPDCQLTKFSLYLNDNKITPNGADLIIKIFTSLNLKQGLGRPFPEILQPQYNYPCFQINFIGKPLIEIENRICDNSLYLQNMKLDEDDIKDICALQSIEKLTIRNCGLKEVPVFPHNYPALLISLANNKFNPNSKDYSIRLKNLFLLPNLRNLNLCNCGITSILPFSSEEKQHCRLKVLTIANNALLPHIAQMLAELPLLEVADFGLCKLTKMPKFISDKLTALKLNHNDFSGNDNDLKWVFEHPTLTKLILDSCNITCIEFEPKQCHLQQLSLAGNKLDQETMVRLGNNTTIRELVLQECSLERDAVQAFALALYNMQQLKQPAKLLTLNLSINNLEKANLEQLFQIESLRILSLSTCNITSLTEFDLTKSQIENLNMAKNPIDRDSIMKLAQMPNLTQLELHGYTMQPKITPEMKLEMAPKIIAKMLLKMTPKMITKIIPWMTLEEISEITSERRSEMVLEMTPEMISEIMSKMTPEMKSEMKLEMESEIISKITQPMFSMSKLEVLNINGCEIPSLGDFGPTVSKIKQLWVAGNQLDDASYAKIAQMPNLTKLNIRQCAPSQKNLAQIFGIKNLEHLEIGEDEFKNVNLRKGGRNIKEVSVGSLNIVDNIVERLTNYIWLPNLGNWNGILYEQTERIKMARRVDNCELYIMPTQPDRESVMALLKHNPSAVYIVVGDTIYAIKNITLKNIGQKTWLGDMIKTTELSGAAHWCLSAEEKAIIAAKTNHHTTMEGCEIHVEPFEVSDEFAIKLLEKNPKVVYIIGNETIYAVEDVTLDQIGKGDWIKDITKNLQPNSKIPLRLSVEEKAIITAKTNHRAPYAYQQQREELYHNANKLKTMRDTNEQKKEQRLEKLNSANAKIENMSKNTLNIFESGGQ